MSDIEIKEAPDFNMDEVEDMPGFISQIDGVYNCLLDLRRDTETKDDKEIDRVIFDFTIKEMIEEKKVHEDQPQPDDRVTVSFSLIPSEKDIEKKQQASGLRFAKPHLITLAKALDCGTGLNEIVKESQGVNCTVTFATRTAKVKDADGDTKIYHNPQIKKLIIS